MADSEPTVSLVVLNLNGRHHLEGSLGSMEALDYPTGKLQVLLFDNGSSDGSAAYARAYHPGVEVIESPSNLGFAEGNNRAVASATGEWIGFLNNDMRVDPPWLRNLLGGLAACPSAASLSSRILSWDGARIDFIGGGVNYQGHGHQLDFGLPPGSRPDIARRLLFACGGAMLIRRDVFVELGGFDEDFFGYFEDTDLGWRLNLLGHDVWYTPEATAFHHHQATWGRNEPHRLRVLYERNALFTIYKCLDDANLAAALPAAMLLMNERALVMGKVDREAFRLDSSSPPPTTRPTPRNRLQRAARILNDEGLPALARKSRQAAGRRVAGGVPLAADAGLMITDPAAVSHYVALSEFGRALGQLVPKRHKVQASRRRSDAEVLAVAGDLLHPNFDEPRYLAFHEHLNRVLGLDARFGAGVE